MTPEFEAILLPNADRIEAVARLTPHTPFNTPAYAAARAMLGEKPCVLTLAVGTTLVAGCVGYLREGKFSRSVEIMTAPRLDHPGVFWDGVRSFCRQQGVWELFIESFAADGVEIPPLPGELSRRRRFEFVMNLADSDPVPLMSENHRRNIIRARRAGLRVRRTREPQAAQAHVRVMQASMERRRLRGESVSMPGGTLPFEALLISEAAELFQATLEEQVLSSMLILRSEGGAYYQSAGTASEGMTNGASHFLIAEVATILQEEGVGVFNLGGAGSGVQGLLRFKTGFGGEIVALEAASFSMMPPVPRQLRAAAGLIRCSPGQLWKVFSGGSSLHPRDR